LLGITTTATGLLCWRDFHPLEWQLASLHQNNSGLPQALCEPLLRQVGAAAASNRAAPDFRHRFQEGGRAKIDTYSVRFAPGIGANTSEGAPKAAFLKGLGLLSVRWRRL